MLSEFTGAAAELRQAYLINPHDLESVKDAIEAAINQTPEEGRRRMRALRRQVLTHDVDLWAGVPQCARANEDRAGRGNSQSPIKPVALKPRCGSRPAK